MGYLQVWVITSKFCECKFSFIWNKFPGKAITEVYGSCMFTYQYSLIRIAKIKLKK